MSENPVAVARPAKTQESMHPRYRCGSKAKMHCRICNVPKRIIDLNDGICVACDSYDGA